MNDTTSVTPPAKDPFDLLLDASGNHELWVLIGGPLAFLLLIVIVYAIIIAVRNKRERASMKWTKRGSSAASSVRRSSIAGRGS